MYKSCLICAMSVIVIGSVADLMASPVVECQFVATQPSGVKFPFGPPQCGPNQFGDFEILGDPPNGPPLMVTNDPSVSGLILQDIVVYELNRESGLWVDPVTLMFPGISTVVADNFYGCYGINGPEWVVPQPGTLTNPAFDPPPPGGTTFPIDMDLGIIYRGLDPVQGCTGTPPDPCVSDGVHSVLRREFASPSTFDQEIPFAGTDTVRTVTALNPVKLPATPPGAHPKPSYSGGHNGYASAGCTPGPCVSDLDGAGLSPVAYCVARNFRAMAGRNDSNASIYAWACDASCGACQLYDVPIPCAGPAAGIPLLTAPVAGFPERSGMATQVFPESPDTIVFVSKEATVPGSPCTPVPSVMPGDDTVRVYVDDDALGMVLLAELTMRAGAGDLLGHVLHFRAEAGKVEEGGMLVDAVVLHYVVRQNVGASAPVGSYAVTVVADPAAPAPHYRGFGPERISTSEKGTELVWLPDARPSWNPPAPGAWALYDLVSDNIRRCWWRPSL